MFYVWTHDLRLSEESFWKTNLKKYDSLHVQFLKAHGLLEDEKMAYINEVF